METNHRKKVGVWLDNSEAHLMEYSTEEMHSSLITSKFTHQVMEESLAKSENIMHNKKRKQQSKFIDEIVAVMKNYEEVLLFGPTEAKIKLSHKLSANKSFIKGKIYLKQTDYMTENQKFAFVRNFFSTNLI